MKIAYEPHPVSKERKAELRAKGLRIIDAKFAPVKPKERKPRKRPEPVEPTIDALTGGDQDGAE